MTKPDRSPPLTGGTRWLLALLMAANAVSFMDRQILVLLMEPIRADLGLSDTAISLVQGLAFILLYSVAAVPIGMLVDRTSRKRIIAAGILIWSVATAAAGLSRSFGQLFAARMAVGLGEATLVPAGVSMLSDRTPRARWGRNIALFTAGGSLGPAVAYVAAGQIYERLPAGGITLALLGPLQRWQVIFLLAALPGSILTLLFLAVPEPARRAPAQPSTDAAGDRRSPIPWLPIMRLLLGLGCMSAFGGALSVWGPTFFIRVHGWSIGNTGLAFGAQALICGFLGTVTGGLISDRLRARGRPDGNIITIVTALGLAWPLAIAFPLPASGVASFVLLAVAYGLLTIAVGAAMPIMPLITASHERGRVTAAYLLTGVAAIGITPTIVAQINERAFADPLRIGQSAALFCGLCVPIGITLLLASRDWAIARQSVLATSITDGG